VRVYYLSDDRFDQREHVKVAHGEDVLLGFPGPGRPVTLAISRTPGGDPIAEFRSETGVIRLSAVDLSVLSEGETGFWNFWTRGNGLVRHGLGPITILRSILPSGPDPLVFVDVVDAPVGSEVISTAVTLAGTFGCLSVSVEEAEYRVGEDGPWRSSPSRVAAGQTLRLRLTAAAEHETTRTATLTVEGVASTWTVTTAAEAVTPPDPPADGFAVSGGAGSIMISALPAVDAPFATGGVASITITATAPPSFLLSGGEGEITITAYPSVPPPRATGGTGQITITE
jgi:hypothetical protein